MAFKSATRRAISPASAGWCSTRRSWSVSSSIAEAILAEPRGRRRSPSGMTLEEKLDEALKQTFPASDAFSLTPASEKDAKPVEQVPKKRPLNSGQRPELRT